MNDGWIKLHRKLKEKAYYKKPPYIFLWIHLLLSANHKPKEFMWNGTIILVKQGQLITGRKELALQTGIKESTVERILKLLENEHQIEQQKTTKYRLITIVKWEDYQNSDSKKNSKRTTSGQQADTNKNDKNVKNEKNIPETSSGEVSILIKSFEGLNPASKRFYGNTTQRQACEDLIKTYSFQKVRSVIENTLPKTNQIGFLPTITTPLQLYEKWSSLEAGIIKLRNKSPRDTVAFK